MFRRSRRGLAALGTAALLVAGIVATAPSASSVGLNFTWNGTAGPSWSAPGNWSPSGPPGAGDNAIFPASSAQLNLAADLGIAGEVNVVFNGAGYTIASGAVVLGPTGIVSSVAGLNQILVPITVTATISQLPLTVAAGGTLSITGVIAGSLGLVKLGPGKVVIGGANTYTAGAFVNLGNFIVNGTAPGTTNVTGGLLGGSGNTGPVNVTSGFLSPGDAGPGLLTINGALSMSGASTYAVEIAGTTPGSGFDRVAANTVSLTGAQLVVSSAFAGSVNQQYLIVDNVSGSPISGTFSGLAEGATVTATTGQTYRITYQGGTGSNDVVLTQLTQASKVQVLGGPDRIDTAVLVSKNSFPTNGSANAVVLARGDLFPDALAGAPLAVTRVVRSCSRPALCRFRRASIVRTIAEIQRVL